MVASRRLVLGRAGTYMRVLFVCEYVCKYVYMFYFFTVLDSMHKFSKVDARRNVYAYIYVCVYQVFVYIL